jgi:hypothetical protein
MSITQTSPNLGMVLPGTSSPDVTDANNVIALITAALLVVDASKGNVQHLTAAGAIAIKPGTVLLNTGTAGAMTLAPPVAGLPGAGGNDGQDLTIIAIDAEAYTVTTTAVNQINGNKHIATFGGAAGDSIRLVAYNGVWYVGDGLNGVTLS